MGILDFFTPEAGQKRRKWLDEKDADITGLLSYLAGPHASEAASQGSGLLAGMSDAADFQEYVDAGRELMTDPSLGGGANLAAAGAAVLLPGVSNKLLKEGGDVVSKGLFDKAAAVRDALEADGVAVELTTHPTAWGNSAYLKAKRGTDGPAYAKAGFRLSDHETGDFRKFSDEFSTIIDDENVTFESLLEGIRRELALGYDEAVVRNSQIVSERASEADLATRKMALWRAQPADVKDEFSRKMGPLSAPKKDRAKLRADQFWKEHGE